MNTNFRSLARLALPKKANDHRQAHLALLLKYHGHGRLHLFVSAIKGHRVREALAQTCVAKRVNILGAEKTKVLLPIPLQASARNSMAK